MNGSWRSPYSALADQPYIARSACRHGVIPDDVQQVLDDPSHVLVMSDLLAVGMSDLSRPNVVVYAGYDIADRPLVIFGDSSENTAFQSEPGMRRLWLVVPTSSRRRLAGRCGEHPAGRGIGLAGSKGRSSVAPSSRPLLLLRSSGSGSATAITRFPCRGGPGVTPR